jgi:hypothetical protein
MTLTDNQPQGVELSTFGTRYGLSIPNGSLDRNQWQELVGTLVESGERIQLYKADMLTYALNNFRVDKRDGKTIRLRLLWEDVYTPEEIAQFTPAQREEFHHFRKPLYQELSAWSGLANSTVGNYLKVARIWTLERRAEFDLSVIRFADFEAVSSQSAVDVPYESQRAILKGIEAARIRVLTESEPDTVEAELPKTNAVLIQAQAVKAARSNGHNGPLNIYPDKTYKRLNVTREELEQITGKAIKPEPNVRGYAIEIKVWCVEEELPRASE